MHRTCFAVSLLALAAAACDEVPPPVDEPPATEAAVEEAIESRESALQKLRATAPGTATVGGLTWTVQDNGRDIDWNQALSYCENLILAGYDDWRLPEIGELEQLHDPAAADTVSAEAEPVVVHVRRPVRLTADWVWSSTGFPNPDGESAYGFDFQSGGRSASRTFVSNGVRALCVRRSGA